MVNTNMTHVFKHPKYYTELRKRNKSDQAISKRQPTGESERASWSGPQASSDKPASNKQQAGEAQASSYKRSSHK